MIKCYFLALLVLHLSACATVYSVPPPGTGTAPGISVGDKVEVITQDGDGHRFKVTRINGTGLGGSKRFFAYTEIKSIRVKQVKSYKNINWVIVAGVALVGLSFAAAKGAKDAGRAVGCAISGNCR